MTERVSYVVTMIHGTFARNALWTSDGSNCARLCGNSFLETS